MRVGIDPSINNTGVCVTDGVNSYYYIISSKLTKKMKEFKHDYITYIPYDKEDTKNDEYSIKEYKKFSNIVRICDKLGEILKLYNIDNVCMEGVSYGSIGSAALVDLSFLNSAIRMTLMKMGVKFTIVSPTSLKKFACANGQADKDIIIDAWKRLDKNIKDVDGIKIDDLADSFFLSRYPINT